MGDRYARGVGVAANIFLKFSWGRYSEKPKFILVSTVLPDRSVDRVSVPIAGIQKYGVTSNRTLSGSGA